MLNNIDWKHQFMLNLPYILIGILVWVALELFGIPFAEHFPSWLTTWMIAVGFMSAIKVYMYFANKNRKNYRNNEEYGSARWGTKMDIHPFKDPNPDNNIILTQTESLTMSSRSPNPEHNRNKNVLVIGGSGSGKTRFYLKPNLMQCQSTDYPVSFVVTDPKGTILVETGEFLREQGYEIRVLNTIRFNKSHRYNPLAYVKTEKDIMSFVFALIKNTSDGEPGAGDPFWEKAETLLFLSLVSYILAVFEPEEQNMGSLLDMINEMEVREDDETFNNAVDYMFLGLKEEIDNGTNKNNIARFAELQYRKYKLATGKTAKSILITAAAQLAPFEVAEVRDLMCIDELELDKIGGYKEKTLVANKKTGKLEEKEVIVKRKTALFVIISDTDAAFNFIVGLMYSQIFKVLTEIGDNDFGGRLPVHVRCLLDEFPNIGLIPDFAKLIATIRSREISVSVILQAQSQLKALYKENMDTIIANCDTFLFLGGADRTTLKDLSESLGKQTITLYNETDTRGQSASKGVNWQRLGRELMTPDEVARLPRSHCILQISSLPPFKSKKFDITKHKNYKYLADVDESRNFDIEAFVSNKGYQNDLKQRRSGKYITGKEAYKLIAQAASKKAI